MPLAVLAVPLGRGGGGGETFGPWRGIMLKKIPALAKVLANEKQSFVRFAEPYKYKIYRLTKKESTILER